MQRHSRPVKPADLGLIGKDHLAARFEAAGVNLETFKYQRSLGETDGIPDVIESAFGWCPDGKNERRIVIDHYRTIYLDPYPRMNRPRDIFQPIICLSLTGMAFSMTLCSGLHTGRGIC
jgi:hypothetical protein